MVSYMSVFNLFMYFLIIAIADGIMENNAFKQNTGDVNNETWTQLLLDLGFFDEHEDHTMVLRRRFVLGASDWFAGNNGSLRNDKETLGYTDAQWGFIWNTMLENGAWAVPGITDAQGNVIKENNAPELLINYIAHDLRCHILVFDLVLDRIQFISGNHLKQNNVVFESPLLLYSTGSHFQSVFQYDHEFFVNLAQQFETEQSGTGLSMEVGAKDINVTNTGKQRGAGKESSGMFAMGQSMSSCSASSGAANVDTCMEGEKGPSMVDWKVSREEENNRPSRETCNEPSRTILSDDDDEDEEFERIKNKKKKDRSPNEQKLFDRIRMRRQRQRETSEVSDQRKKLDREYKRTMREKETNDQATQRKEQAKEYERNKRERETLTETTKRLEKAKEYERNKRERETSTEATKRLEQAKEYEKNKRERET